MVQMVNLKKEGFNYPQQREGAEMNTLDQEIKGLQIAIDILADALKKRNRLATELQKARERAYPHNITTVEVSVDPRPYPCVEVEE